MQIPKFLSSSVDPEQLGLTIKGLLVAIIPTVLLIAGVAHINLGQADLSQFVDATVNVVIAVSTALSAFMVLVGIVRKIAVSLGIIKSKAQQ